MACIQGSCACAARTTDTEALTAVLVAGDTPSLAVDTLAYLPGGQQLVNVIPVDAGAVVIWLESSSLRARLFSTEGAPLGDAVVITDVALPYNVDGDGHRGLIFWNDLQSIGRTRRALRGHLERGRRSNPSIARGPRRRAPDLDRNELLGRRRQQFDTDLATRERRLRQLRPRRPRRQCPGRGLALLASARRGSLPALQESPSQWLCRRPLGSALMSYSAYLLPRRIPPFPGRDARRARATEPTRPRPTARSHGGPRGTRRSVSRMAFADPGGAARSADRPSRKLKTDDETRPLLAWPNAKSSSKNLQAPGTALLRDCFLDGPRAWLGGHGGAACSSSRGDSKGSGGSGATDVTGAGAATSRAIVFSPASASALSTLTISSSGRPQ
jgi:hypothetical protein